MALARAGLLAMLLSCVAVADCVAESVTVFAAASLAGALNQLWPRQRHPEVSLSFGGSSLLARQIDAGAPADLYLSASTDWMDYLQTRGRIDSTTRRDLLGNRVVLITPRGRGFVVRPQDNLSALFGGRLALADPAHVPAGQYARQALESLGWWNALQQRLAPAGDVRGALTWVERGECAAGIVYATDAMASHSVEVVFSFADSLHAPIRYPVALVQGRVSATTRRYLDTLASPAALEVFRQHGFAVIDRKP